MFNEQEKSTLEKAIKTYGTRSQIDVAIEEMAELTKALMKDRRNCAFHKNDFETMMNGAYSVCEEIADVLITMEQLQMIFSDADEVEEIKEEKIHRLENRLRRYNMENKQAKETREIKVMDDLGRVCIPKKIRQKLCFGMGDRFIVREKDGGIFLVKVMEE